MKTNNDTTTATIYFLSPDKDDVISQLANAAIQNMGDYSGMVHVLVKLTDNLAADITTDGVNTYHVDDDRELLADIANRVKAYVQIELTSQEVNDSLALLLEYVRARKKVSAKSLINFFQKNLVDDSVYLCTDLAIEVCHLDELGTGTWSPYNLYKALKSAYHHGANVKLPPISKVWKRDNESIFKA